VSAEIGYSANVATVTGTFEVRHVNISTSMTDAVTAGDDLRVFGIDLLKGAFGTPTDAWVQADFDAAVAAIDAFWGSIKDRYHAYTNLKKIAFYKRGPAIVPPQPPVYQVDRAVAGTSAVNPLPPQAAITVTEMAGAKPHWGRFYLPSPASDSVNIYGRISSAVATDIADAADVMYEAFKTAGIPAVVYRPALGVRQTAAEKRAGTTPGSLAARTASAWTVDKLQVDDVYDVIRSRRWKNPTTRLQRELA